MLSILRHPTCALLLICFTLGGCASKYAQQTTVVNQYPQCYSPIEELRIAESNFQSTVVTTTAISTLLGAAIGFLSTGDARGAVIGAAAGAASGLAIGYAKAKRDEHQDTNARMASYLRDLDGDINGLNEVTAAARLAIQCYNREFQIALSEFKSKTITRAQLDTRYYEILSGTQEAERIMGVAITNTEPREEQYQAAVNFEREQAPSDESSIVVAEQAPPKKVLAAKPKAKKVLAAKPKAKKAVVKETAPVLVAETAPVVEEKELPQPAAVEATVAGLEEQAEVYADTRSALIGTQEVAVVMRASWAADLAALES